MLEIVTIAAAMLYAFAILWPPPRGLRPQDIKGYI